VEDCLRLLLIEDDQRLASLVKEVLEEEGFSVDMAHEGDIGLELGLRRIYDIAIIDWMLPGMDGPTIVRELRSANVTTAILLLTARSQVEDRVQGLDSGADDYLVKPFSFDELLARVRALGRRSRDKLTGNMELRCGQLVLDNKTHTARRGEKTLELTITEWTLLEYLMRHPGQVLSRQNIMDYVWSYENEVQSTMVDVYISYLRSKLNVPGMKDPIDTVRGVGYRLVEKHA
jgi:two-component system, OmpR family, response regulator